MAKTSKKLETEPLVEIIDNMGLPLLYMPLSLATKKGLTRAIVLVIVQNSQKKIFLQKHGKTSKSYSNLWDISIYGNVYATEAFEDAARRELKQQLDIDITQLYSISTLPYTNTQGVSLLASVFTTPPLYFNPKIDSTRFSDSMFLTTDELKALAAHSPELLTPELIWAAQSNWFKA